MNFWRSAGVRGQQERSVACCNELLHNGMVAQEMKNQNRKPESSEPCGALSFVSLVFEFPSSFCSLKSPWLVQRVLGIFCRLLGFRPKRGKNKKKQRTEFWGHSSQTHSKAHPLHFLHFPRFVVRIPQFSAFSAQRNLLRPSLRQC